MGLQRMNIVSGMNFLQMAICIIGTEKILCYLVWMIYQISSLDSTTVVEFIIMEVKLKEVPGLWRKI